jgi:predicted Rossmann fold flavoprotein
MAAIACGERAQKEGAALRLRVLDSQTKIGAKILVAGGGRCNVTNVHVDANRFHTTNPDRSPKSFVSRVLRSFSVEETHRFFERLDVPLKLEPEMGKYFPVADSGKVVLRALLDAAHNAGAELVTGCAVTNIEYSNDEQLWHVATSQGAMTARVVILCTGGLALPKSGSDGRGLRFAKALGHDLVATTPALTPLLAQPAIHAGLSGVTLPARLFLKHENRVLADFTGSFLFTHVGYSGPVALNISRHFARFHLQNPSQKATIYLRLLTDVKDGEEGKWWHSFVQKNAKKNVANALVELLPRRIAESIHEYSKSRDNSLGRLTREQSEAVKTALFAWPLPVHQVADYVKAETTAGGVPLDEIESATMMSKKRDGLFFAGEICDVDGWLGGYNFQWAWSSGAVAGRSAAKYAIQKSAAPASI